MSELFLNLLGAIAVYLLPAFLVFAGIVGGNDKERPFGKAIFIALSWPIALLVEVGTVIGKNDDWFKKSK